VVLAGEPVVVGLLYRADWTRLSLAAATGGGAAVLVAPGRRYRYQSGDYLTGCDGTRPWELRGDDEDDAYGQVHWVSGPQPPLPELLCPAWLLTGSQLQVRGRVRACGRDAWDVLVSPRPGSGRAIATRLPGPLEAVVDADLGIVLRLVRDAGTPDPQVTELASLDLDVVIDPVRFAAPSGSRRGESLGEAFGGGGPAGWAARAVSGVAAGGVGAWIRHSRSSVQPPTAGDGEEMMPPADPAPEIAADGVPAGPPVIDDLLARLHEGGAGHFTAAVHQWVDVGAMASQIPAGARRVGFGGVGLLADAVGEQPAARLVSAVRFGGPGQYQIDHSHSPRRGTATIACDGQRRWQVRDGTATLGPPGPPPKEFADLADPSWLLQCRLSGGEAVTADGRPGYRLSVARGAEGWLSMTFPAAVAVIDAELGIIQRLTYYIGGKPVHRSELRDITASDEEFRTDLPPGLTVTEETSRFGDSRNGPPAPVSIPLAIATAIGRQAATEAGKAARNLLNRLEGHQPQDGE
jgi:hypothetical protein